jgi:predicted MPP superfamily phosphohydrolase
MYGVLFFVIIFGILAGNGLWWIWAHRSARRLRRSRIWRSVIAAFVSLQLGYILFFVVAPVLARRGHVWMPMPIVISIYLWSLLVMPATVLTVLVAQLIRWARRAFAPTDVATTPASPSAGLKRGDAGVAATPHYRDRETEGFSRRRLLTATAIAAPPLAAIAMTGRAIPQLGSLRVRSIDVPIPNLPPPLDGLKIAHVSDTHIGRFTRPGSLAQISEITNRLRADLVVFTGDLIDMSLADLPAGIDFLRQLDPRHGMMIIEGNHDLFIDPGVFEQRLTQAGLPVLFDDARTLNIRGIQIQFLGIRWGQKSDWPRRHSSNAVIRESVARVLRMRDPNAFSILLAHHPHAFDPAIQAVIPLTLSGHTHGGQLMLTEKLGAGSIAFKYWSGLYRRNDSSLVVSNGTGNWFPLRINAPAEIVHITLRA